MPHGVVSVPVMMAPVVMQPRVFAQEMLSYGYPACPLCRAP